MTKRIVLLVIVAMMLSGSIASTTSVLIAQENFEGAMSCRLVSVGSYPVAPGIKSGMGIDGSKAYGFGRSSCAGSALDGYVNDLIFTFSKKYVITRVEFWEMERYGNWGSEGWLMANGTILENTTFARLPENDFIADTSFRKRDFVLNVICDELTFRCWDITEESELFIDEIRIYGYAYEGIHTVIFSGMGGCGTMISQEFQDGNLQRLTKNSYAKDGYVFQGWAETEADADNGIVKLRDEAEIVVDHDMTLYAVWANPPLTLVAESADWSDGTITLRCEDADDSGSEHEYYLSYYETVEQVKKWYDIEGATRIKASREIDSNGKGIWVARLPDGRFAKRNMGVGVVRYRVCDENRRMAECETRHRHGLFVAVGEYEDPRVKSLPTARHECAVFRDAYIRYGCDEWGFCCTADVKPTRSEVLFILSAMVDKVHPGDIFLFYFAGHGGNGYLCCYDFDYDKAGKITASDLHEHFQNFCDGAGMVSVIYCCFSASMYVQDNNSLNLGRVGWIVSSQPDETTRGRSLTSIICNKGWFNGEADLYNGEYGDGNGDGYVTFLELGKYGFDWTLNNDVEEGHRQQMEPMNTFILGNIVAGKVPTNSKEDRMWRWFTQSESIYASASGDIDVATSMTAANGCRTVGECYELGIDPEDPNDDLRITDFKMVDGKPVITLNHTVDGSGNSFLPRAKTLGKSSLTGQEEWREVPEEGDPDMRFFKVAVEMP